MAFGKRQTNNENSEKNCNTKGIQFFNIEGIEPSTLNVAYWNQNLVLKIHPALAENKRTESSKYDYNVFAGAYLTIQKAKVLLKAIVEKFIPEVNANPNKEISYGVMTGDGLVEINNGIKFGSKNMIAITIYDKIDTENGKCDQYLTYQFNMSDVIANYSKDTGNYNEIEIDGEFSVFMDYLINFVAAMTNAYTHADRNVNKYSYDKQMENTKTIMKALGVQIDDDDSSNSGGNRVSYFAKKNNQSGFGGGNNTPKDEQKLSAERQDKTISTDDVDAIERELMAG